MYGELTLYFIIEHPTRGILKEEPAPSGKPSFGLGWRTDERAARFFSLRRAIQTWQEEGLPKGCVIRASQWKDDGYHAAWPVVWPPEGKR